LSVCVGLKKGVFARQGSRFAGGGKGGRKWKEGSIKGAAPHAFRGQGSFLSGKNLGRKQDLGGNQREKMRRRQTGSSSKMKREMIKGGSVLGAAWKEAEVRTGRLSTRDTKTKRKKG